MKNFEVNQVLKLPADKEYVAYPIEGVRQLALDNKPANVKIFISQNSMRQNARELRNRDDGYGELPELINRLYLFTEGISEGDFIEINYTGNSGNYYKYGNDTISQVDKIDSVREIKEIKIIENLGDEIRELVNPTKLTFEAEYKMELFFSEIEKNASAYLKNFKVFYKKEEIYRVEGNLFLDDSFEITKMGKLPQSIYNRFNEACLFKTKMLIPKIKIPLTYHMDTKKVPPQEFSKMTFFSEKTCFVFYVFFTSFEFRIYNSFPSISEHKNDIFFEEYNKNDEKYFLGDEGFFAPISKKFNIKIIKLFEQDKESEVFIYDFFKFYNGEFGTFKICGTIEPV